MSLIWSDYLNFDGVQPLHDLVQVHVDAPGLGDWTKRHDFLLIPSNPCLFFFIFLTSIVIYELGCVLGAVTLAVAHGLLLPPQERRLLPTSPGGRRRRSQLKAALELLNIDRI